MPFRETYNCDAGRTKARGVSVSPDQVDDLRCGRVSEILFDDAGQAELTALLGELPTSGFGDTAVRRVLERDDTVRDWQVGESIAQYYVEEVCDGCFPWPHSRDQRNPQSSQAGADLVGFQQDTAAPDSYRFAFGEVKTSQQQQYPPSVVYGEDGLRGQMKSLRDDRAKRDHFFRYLGLRARGTEWKSRFESAATRYLGDSKDVTLFGVLVRDVSPHQDDLANCASFLDNGCSNTTNIELRAIYFPTGNISTFVETVTTAREDDGTP